MKKLPRPQDNVSAIRQFDISCLYAYLECPTLFNMKLPTFQRDFKWNEKQNVAFIESVVMRLPLGTYMVNDIFTNNAKIEYDHYLNNIIVDGKHRLNALHLYFNDKFRVHDLLWSELDIKDKRWILGTPFHCIVLNEQNEGKLRDIYNHLNFSGTPHNENEKA
jgi:uncharacterized protein with ParB-like and HNH nuclease domain